MIRFRPLPLMTILSVIALAVLLSLGRWQWERFEQKRALAEEPVPQMTIEDYRPVSGGLQFVYGVRSDTHEPGWRVFAPVQYGDTVIFIDSDFIQSVEPPNPSEIRLPASLRLGAPITGASIRPDPPSRMAPPPRPLQRLWFAVDLGAMGRNAGLAEVANYYLACPYVGTDGRSIANPFALAPGTDILPPARHLGYSLTWYGLALVLLAIYFAYHISVKRLVFAPSPPRRE